MFQLVPTAPCLVIDCQKLKNKIRCLKHGSIMKRSIVFNQSTNSTTELQLYSKTQLSNWWNTVTVQCLKNFSPEGPSGSRSPACSIPTALLGDEVTLTLPWWSWGVPSNSGHPMILWELLLKHHCRIECSFLPCQVLCNHTMVFLMKTDIKCAHILF